MKMKRMTIMLLAAAMTLNMSMPALPGEDNAATTEVAATVNEEEAAAKAAAEREAARQAELAAKKNSGGGFGSILGGAGGKLGDIKDMLSEAADGFDAEEALGSAKNALKGLFGKK